MSGGGPMDHHQRRRQLIATHLLSARLRHVRWLGGGSGAGKTTIARTLTSEHGLRLYSCDDAVAGHARRANPADTPLLQAFLAMTMDERWLCRAPTQMCETFPWFQGEGFDLIVEDLLALPEQPLVLAEGFRLLPRLVAPLLSLSNQAVWLVPTYDFRRAAFDRRGFTWDIPLKTSDPQRALSNLLGRDQLFTDQVLKEAIALHLQVVEVDGGLGLADMARRVGTALSLRPLPRPGP